MADANVKRGSKAERPLSPHLQVYKMPVNMVMSIVHRITGGALYVGTLIVVAVLVAAASGSEAYAFVTGLLGSWLGLPVIFGYTWALSHHMAGGIRHFIWDTGAGYELDTVDFLSWATLAVSVVMTLLIWGYVLLGGAS